MAWLDGWAFDENDPRSQGLWGSVGNLGLGLLSAGMGDRRGMLMGMQGAMAAPYEAKERAAVAKRQGMSDQLTQARLDEMKRQQDARDRLAGLVGEKGFDINDPTVRAELAKDPDIAEMMVKSQIGGGANMFAPKAAFDQSGNLVYMQASPAGGARTLEGYRPLPQEFGMEYGPDGKIRPMAGYLDSRRQVTAANQQSTVTREVVDPQTGAKYQVDVPNPSAQPPGAAGGLPSWPSTMPLGGAQGAPRQTELGPGEKAKLEEGSKPLTETQSKDVGFLTRMKEAEGTLGSLNYDPTTLSAWKDQAAAGHAATNWAASNEGQQYKAAKEAWITALLRKESGAAIPQWEMDKYDRTFFPQPGDSAEVVAQKAKLRSAQSAAIEQNLPGRASVPSSGPSRKSLEEKYGIPPR